MLYLKYEYRYNRVTFYMVSVIRYFCRSLLDTGTYVCVKQKGNNIENTRKIDHTHVTKVI